MEQQINRLDEVLELFNNRFDGTGPFSTDEPFASETPPGLHAPLRALTILMSDKPFVLLGLTAQSVSPLSASFVGYIARRARARHIEYLILCNQRETQLVQTPNRIDDSPEKLRTYPILQSFNYQSSGSLTPTEKIALEQLADQLMSDLARLKRDGRMDLVLPDAEFFVDRLTRAVDVLKPAVQKALQTKLGMDVQFAKLLEVWATPQGIPADLRSPDFAEAVVRQAIYRLLGKIIFYQSLRRSIPGLPEMDMAKLDTAQVMPHLERCFNEAHKIDYHAVFREDIVDRLPFPEIASAELRDLVEDLNTRDFAHLPQDVVGAVFERLIPTEDRHALGQYFTPEPLVDLILAFCVRNPNDTVLDPTCGTGTFLIRAYDRLCNRLGNHDHNQLLGQLWGVDIAPFPAELATINLFRQRVGQIANFPRVLNEDFFEVIPGGKYRFPPLKADSNRDLSVTGIVDESIPVFDAIVGNFPYINAANIETRQKGYLEKVRQRLAEEWLSTYPEGFYFKQKTDQKEHTLAHQNGLNISQFINKAETTISSFADLYVSLFWHAAAFLKPGGRMGIVTSNAWLDVGYGYALQKFILDHFKILAILESRCEPWFDQAAVNTIVTIVERCNSQVERDENMARFVQIQRPLDELIPWDMHLNALERWMGLDKLVQRIRTYPSPFTKEPIVDEAPINYEDGSFRIRAIRQRKLRSELERKGKTIKWGPYLRAPQVYYDLLNQAGEQLAYLGEIAPPAFGSKTGINAFFHFDDEKIAKWDIESEFLFSLLKSPGDSDHIWINEEDLRLKVFICRMSKEQLIERGKINALRYIEWGEQQVFTSGAQAGLTWPHGAEVKNRKPGWYALPEYRSRLGQIFFPQAFGERFITKYCPNKLIADARLYFLSPINGISNDIVAGIMNSFFVAFFTELAGRVTMGDGALELKVEDARDYLLIPDPRCFNKKSLNAIREAFQLLIKRPILNIFEEIQQPDRQALDRAVLQAMGLEPNEWLPRIYDGLTTLVQQRIQLAQMRTQQRQSKPQKAARRVTDEVLQDLLPEGPCCFPEDFLSPEARAAGFVEVHLPQNPLKIKGMFFQKVELATENGEKLDASNHFEAKYLIYAQACGQPVARVPLKPVEVSRTVNNYIQYLRKLSEDLNTAYYIRTLDQAAADRFVDEVWQKYKLPKMEP